MQQNVHYIQKWKQNVWKRYNNNKRFSVSLTLGAGRSKDIQTLCWLDLKIAKRYSTYLRVVFKKEGYKRIYFNVIQ